MAVGNRGYPDKAWPAPGWRRFYRAVGSMAVGNRGYPDKAWPAPGWRRFYRAVGSMAVGNRGYPDEAWPAPGWRRFYRAVGSMAVGNRGYPDEAWPAPGCGYRRLETAATQTKPSLRQACGLTWHASTVTRPNPAAGPQSKISNPKSKIQVMARPNRGSNRQGTGRLVCARPWIGEPGRGQDTDRAIIHRLGQVGSPPGISGQPAVQERGPTASWGWYGTQLHENRCSRCGCSGCCCCGRRSARSSHYC